MSLECEEGKENLILDRLTILQYVENQLITNKYQGNIHQDCDVAKNLVARKGMIHYSILSVFAGLTVAAFID